MKSSTLVVPCRTILIHIHELRLDVVFVHKLTRIGTALLFLFWDFCKASPASQLVGHEWSNLDEWSSSCSSCLWCSFGRPQIPAIYGTIHPSKSDSGCDRATPDFRSALSTRNKRNKRDSYWNCCRSNDVDQQVTPWDRTLLGHDIKQYFTFKRPRCAPQPIHGLQPKNSEPKSDGLQPTNWHPNMDCTLPQFIIHHHASHHSSTHIKQHQIITLYLPLVRAKTFSRACHHSRKLAIWGIECEPLVSATF